MTDHIDDLEVEEPGLQPAASSSPLAGIRSGLFDGVEEEVVEREEEDRWLDLAIPTLRLSRFTVFARFDKVEDHKMLRRMFDPPAKVKRARPDWDLHANVDLLLHANEGVYAQTAEGTRYAFDRSRQDKESPDGPWPTFAADWEVIADLLPRGEEIRDARMLILRLYSPGAVITTGDAIAKHSDYDQAVLTGN